MNNWRVFLALFFSIIYVPVYGQNEQLQKLLALLNEGRYFEAKDLYNEISDSVPLNIASYYKFRMAESMNRKGLAVNELEKSLSSYPDLFGNETIDIYSLLFNTYRNLGKYEKVIGLYKLAREHLKKNPYNLNKEELALRKRNLEEAFSYFKEVSSRPSIKIHRKATNESIKMEDSLMLGFKAKFNGVPQMTILDTGVDSYILMKKTTAKAIGIRLKSESKGTLNGVEMMGEENMVDSIEIGNITLYNIPVIIYDFDLTSCLSDSIRKDSSIMERFKMADKYLENPIIGLPSMLLIGKIEIDWENRNIFFPYKNSDILREDNNLFVFNNMLYARLKINRTPFTGLLDSGSDDYINMDTTFYQKYQKEIPIDTTAVKEKLNIASVHGVQLDVKYMIADNPIIEFNERTIGYTGKHNIQIYPMFLPYLVSDGVLGINFMKSIGRKILLDFDNMRLEVEE